VCHLPNLQQLKQAYITYNIKIFEEALRSRHCKSYARSSHQE